MKDCNSDELTQKVAKWLSASGYPLEMRVSSAFRKAGFRVFQSDSYIDPETGETREIDVVAVRELETPEFMVSLHFVVECKLSPDKPWILFLNGGKVNNKRGLVAQNIANGMGQALLRTMAIKAPDLVGTLLCPSAPFAYGMTEALAKDGNSNCYKAIMSSSKAAAAGAVKAGGQHLWLNQLSVFLPAIVVDGALFNAQLQDDSGELQLDRIDGGTLVLRNPTAPFTLISVTSASSIDDFIAKCSATADALLENASKHEKRILGAIRSHPDFYSDE